MTEQLKVLRKHCVYPNESATNGELAELEERLQVQLPPDYVAFLTKLNGGVFRELNMQTPWHPESGDELESLRGVGAGVVGSGRTLGSDADLALFDDNWPIVFLPIGRSLLGHLLLMDFTEETHGEIWIKKAFDSEGFSPFYESFDAFLKALVENA